VAYRLTNLAPIEARAGHDLWTIFGKYGPRALSAIQSLPRSNESKKKQGLLSLVSKFFA
jgi:hypothetical protein